MDACSIVNYLPHTQLEGNSGGSKAQRIMKSTFVLHSQLERDRAVTQLEEPFSEDNMMDLYKDGNRAEVAKHHRSQ